MRSHFCIVVILQQIILSILSIPLKTVRIVLSTYVVTMLNKNTLGVKKVRGQSEATLQIGTYVRPKTLISVEAKKLLIKNLFNYLNDIQ